MDEYVPDEISFWAEVLSGSLVERAEALAARGGAMMKSSRPVPKKCQGDYSQALYWNRSMALSTRPEWDPKKGPRLNVTTVIIMEMLYLDTISRRDQMGSRTMAYVMHEAIKRFGLVEIVVDEKHKNKGVGTNVSRLIGRAAP